MRAPTPLPRPASRGLSDFFGSPKFKDFASNALMDLGYGLTRGTDLNQGFQMATQRTAEMQPARDAYATSEAEKAQRLEQLNKTVEYLRSQANGATWADAIENGMIDPKDAFKGWYEQSKGTDGPEPTANMRDYQFAQENPGYADFLNPSKPADKPAAIREYEYAVSQGYEGTFADYETEMKRAGATSIDFNANQGAAAGYADRMAAANEVLNDPKLEAAQTDLVEQGKAGVPVVGNFLTSEEKKLADQAQRDFINAILRRESGAVISPSEFENAKQQYFPQPGDTDAVKQQKKRNRETAIAGVARSAGPNYAPPGGLDDPLGIR